MNQKKLKNAFSKGMKHIITHILKQDANRTTCAGIYQPAVPAELQKFSRFNKNDKSVILENSSNID